MTFTHRPLTGTRTSQSSAQPTILIKVIDNPNFIKFVLWLSAGLTLAVTPQKKDNRKDRTVLFWGLFWVYPTTIFTIFLGTTITLRIVLPSIHLADNSCFIAIFSIVSFSRLAATVISKRRFPLNATG